MHTTNPEHDQHRALTETTDHTPCMVCAGPCGPEATTRPLTHPRAGTTTWWRLCRFCLAEEHGAFPEALAAHPALKGLDLSTPHARAASAETDHPFYAIDALGTHRNPRARPRKRWHFPEVDQWAAHIIDRADAHRPRPAPDTGLACPRCGRSRSRGWAQVPTGQPGGTVWVCAAASGDHTGPTPRADGFCAGVRAWNPGQLGERVPTADAHDRARRRNPSAVLPDRFFGCRDRAALEAAGLTRRVRGTDAHRIIGDFALRSGWWAPTEDQRWGTPLWGTDWGPWEYLGAGAARALQDAHRTLTEPGPAPGRVNTLTRPEGAQGPVGG